MGQSCYLTQIRNKICQNFYFINIRNTKTPNIDTKIFDLVLNEDDPRQFCKIIINVTKVNNVQ